MSLAEIALGCFLAVKAVMVGHKEEPEKRAGSRSRTEQNKAPSGSFADMKKVVNQSKACLRAHCVVVPVLVAGV